LTIYKLTNFRFVDQQGCLLVILFVYKDYTNLMIVFATFTQFFFSVANIGKYNFNVFLCIVNLLLGILISKCINFVLYDILTIYKVKYFTLVTHND